MASENKTIKDITKEMKRKDRFFVNIHGNHMGNKNGMFDFIMVDKDGRFLGVEAKSSTGKPYPTQLRRCKEVLELGGRAVIAYPNDFNIEAIDKHEIPKYNYIDEDTKLPKYTHEIVLKGGLIYGEER